MTQTMLETHELTKKYGEFTALSNVSLDLHEGDVYGLVGRNGAGKTTFFKCVMGLTRPSSGSIAIVGDSNNLGAARRKIGFTISNAFFSYLNPRESLEYLCRVKGVRASKAEVARLLELVGLVGVKKPFKAFSMGMKQRLGIAGALLGSPPIVVLDEPINGLDPQGIIDVRDTIKNIHQATGTTFIISSHILSELDLVATRFGFLEQGVLLKQVSHQDLHEQTKKSLVLETSDAAAAKALIESQLGLAASPTPGKPEALTLESGLERSHEIARLLVQNNISLFEMHRRENTLEDYFIRLIGGEKDA
jgi:ABC-2 type transport system ATP-binding protein